MAESGIVLIIDLLMVAIMILVAAIMIGIGISCFRSSSPVGFYSEKPPYEYQLINVQAWNNKHGMMWLIYGIVIIISSFIGYIIRDNPLCIIPFCGGIIVPIVLMIWYHRKLIRQYKIENMSWVAYTKYEKEIVRKGITAIREVLMGGNADRKRSLLFCLDWFMDPYYGQDISAIESDLIELLQIVVISYNEIDVKDDALQLLEDYAWGPFEILEENYEAIEDELRGEADYTINMHRIFQIENLMLVECKKVYKEIRTEFSQTSNKVWIIHNSHLSETKEYNYNLEIESEWLLEDGEINNSPPAHYSKRVVSLNEEGFYLYPEMHFNILLNDNKVLLIYYFGKRFAKCLTYDLVSVDDDYKIENPQVMWVTS